MGRYVALLRGINVGGRNKVPMAALRAACDAEGWQDVQSYIASGNLVFSAAGDAAGLTMTLQDILQRDFGVKARVLMLSQAQMCRANSGCPWPEAAGNLVHGLFCFDTPHVDPAAYEQHKIALEELVVVGHTVWLHAPDGVGRSKLFAKMDKVLPDVATTARNLNTVRKLTEMVDAGDATC